MWIVHKAITASVDLQKKRQPAVLAQHHIYGSKVWKKGYLYLIVTLHGKGNSIRVWQSQVQASPVQQPILSQTVPSLHRLVNPFPCYKAEWSEHISA